MSLKGNIFIFLMRLQRNLLYLFHCILLVYLIICLWTLKFQLISVLWPRLSRIWCCSSILSTHLKQILCLAILHTKVNYSETLLFISWLLYVCKVKEMSYQFSDCVTESLDWVIFRESLLNMLLVWSTSITKNALFSLLCLHGFKLTLFI